MMNLSIIYSLFIFTLNVLIIYCKGDCPPSYTQTPSGCILGGNGGSFIGVIQCKHITDSQLNYIKITNTSNDSSCIDNNYNIDKFYVLNNFDRKLTWTLCKNTNDNTFYGILQSFQSTIQVCTQSNEVIVQTIDYDFSTYPNWQYRYLVTETCADSNGMTYIKPSTVMTTTTNQCQQQLWYSVYDMGLKYPCNSYCKNGGTCSSQSGLCSCTPQWTGSDCTNDVNECTTIKPCKGISSCFNTQGGYTCLCPNGYTLSSTNNSCVDIDECSDSPCSGTSQCLNTPGSYVCSCPQGYRYTSNDCYDINECADSSDLCDSVSTNCNNTIGSYECNCKPGYIRSSTTPSLYQCLGLPNITSLYQVSKTQYNLIGASNMSSITGIKIGNVSCDNPININSTAIRCTVKSGLEVIGLVSVKITDISDSFIPTSIGYAGSPFIVSISPFNDYLSSLTIIGRNFPIVSPVVRIGSEMCDVSDHNSTHIICMPSRGTGSRSITIRNESIENTDNYQITFPTPRIGRNSSFDTHTKLAKVYGSNFGNDVSVVQVKVGRFPCQNVTIIGDLQSLIECQVLAQLEPITYNLQVVVDGVSSSNSFYVDGTNNILQPIECPSNCSGHGTCHPQFGCQCDSGFTGFSCDQVLIDSLPTLPTNNNNNNTISSIQLGDTNNLYLISIYSIQELSESNNNVTIIQRYNLTEVNWSMETQTTENSTYWRFTTILDNNSTIQANFEYVQGEGGSDFLFSNHSFHLNQYTLKVSINVSQWSFSSGSNTLKVLVRSETLGENDCGQLNKRVDNETSGGYLNIEIQNTDTGIDGRFLTIAQVDDASIVGKVTQEMVQEDEEDNSVIIIGISVPAFQNYAYLDPHYSSYLRVDAEAGKFSCSGKKTDWRLMVGIVLGTAAIVVIIVSIAPAIQKWKERKEYEKQELEDEIAAANAAAQAAAYEQMMEQQVVDFEYTRERRATL